MSEAVITVQSLVAQMRRRLEASGAGDPLADTRLLIGDIIGFSLTDFVLNGSRVVTKDEVAQAESLIARRETGEPVHRILGHREFYGLDFLLSQETLEPRPDTEVLVDALLPRLRAIVEKKGAANILDIGVGTGAICLSLLYNCAEAKGIGSDVSIDALKTARNNAVRHGLVDRFGTVESNWFDAISGQFDIIVSNPPYIRSDVIATLDRDVKDFDPMLALDGGQDGLTPYRVIAENAANFLFEQGLIGVEIGYDQKEDVTEIFTSQGYSLVKAVKDYGGNDRALIFCR